MFWLESAIVARYTRFLCSICWYLCGRRCTVTGREETRRARGRAAPLCPYSL